MKSHASPNQGSEQTQPLQPGLDPSKTGKPKQSDPRTDPQPGQEKKKGELGYRPDR